jgi:hypothetical protein
VSEDERVAVGERAACDALAGAPRAVLRADVIRACRLDIR